MARRLFEVEGILSGTTAVVELVGNRALVLGSIVPTIASSWAIVLPSSTSSRGMEVAYEDKRPEARARLLRELAVDGRRTTKRFAEWHIREAGTIFKLMVALSGRELVQLAGLDAVHDDLGGDNSVGKNEARERIENRVLGEPGRSLLDLPEDEPVEAAPIDETEPLDVELLARTRRAMEGF